MYMHELASYIAFVSKYISKTILIFLIVLYITFFIFLYFNVFLYIFNALNISTFYQLNLKEKTSRVKYTDVVLSTKIKLLTL